MMPTLNPKRIMKLITNDLLLHKKLILIVTATLFVFSLLLPELMAANQAVYFIILYGVGFIISSFAFNDLHETRKAYLWLMLPSSSLEKFISKWLLTSMIFALGSLIIYYILSFVILLFFALINKQSVSMPIFFDTNLWLGIGKYVILQAVILLGAINFKRFTLIKTALSVGCIFVLISLIVLALAGLFYPFSHHAFASFLRATVEGWHFIFWIALAPFCWYLTYLKLTESELA